MDNHLQTTDIAQIIAILSDRVRTLHKTLIAELIEQFGRDPFIILIACLLSLRAKDSATLPVCRKLFLKACTPQDLLEIPTDTLYEILRPLGFYRKKAAVLQRVCRELLDRHEGRVPNTEAELRALYGVGLKTTNLVLAEAFGIPAICVDTHVHRIVNRLGWMATKTPEQTEQKLRILVPQEQWLSLNRLFVVWGQSICVPISPFCSRCPLAYGLCKQREVGKKR